jgi:hypothetical protein
MVGGELVDCPFTTEPADARRLFAAECRIGIIIEPRIVDMGHSRVDPPRESNGTVDVRAEHGRGQPILRVVGKSQGVVFVVGPKDGYDGTEDLFACRGDRCRR